LKIWKAEKCESDDDKFDNESDSETSSDSEAIVNRKINVTVPETNSCDNVMQCETDGVTKCDNENVNVSAMFETGCDKSKSEGQKSVM